MWKLYLASLGSVLKKHWGHPNKPLTAVKRMETSMNIKDLPTNTRTVFVQPSPMVILVLVFRRIDRASARCARNGLKGGIASRTILQVGGAQNVTKNRNADCQQFIRTTTTSMESINNNSWDYKKDRKISNQGLSFPRTELKMEQERGQSQSCRQQKRMLARFKMHIL